MIIEIGLRMSQLKVSSYIVNKNEDQVENIEAAIATFNVNTC